MLARAALAVSCCALYLALGAVGAAAADRVYWTSYGTNAISYANLDGSGGGDVDVGGATIHQPSGIALNPAANRVYWTNYDKVGVTDTIGFANLDGSAGAGNLDLTGALRNSRAASPWTRPRTALLVESGEQHDLLCQS